MRPLGTHRVWGHLCCSLVRAPFSARTAQRDPTDQQTEPNECVHHPLPASSLRASGGAAGAVSAAQEVPVPAVVAFWEEQQFDAPHQGQVPGHREHRQDKNGSVKEAAAQKLQQSLRLR
jgi:hypothetical protein